MACGNVEFRKPLSKRQKLLAGELADGDFDFVDSAHTATIVQLNGAASLEVRRAKLINGWRIWVSGETEFQGEAAFPKRFANFGNERELSSQELLD